jgi:DNA polymerase-3 subunit gamma/tau
MSEYIVTARKWRPMVFEDVVGQSHITQTLRNAIGSQRLAHAYIFSGPRGVGKTTTARLLAKAINCRHPKDSNPDNECDICKEITDGTSFDVLEIDGASNRGIDEIRDLRESARYAPAKGKYKIYVIDEVHMLTKESFNALLKTLEEPPAHVMFIFATTEIHKVPATILSRCQRFDFRRIAIEEIIANLRAIAREEQIDMDDEALMLVARKGDGSLRDAQSIFDQVVSLCGRCITHTQILEALNIVDEEVYFRMTDLIKARNAKGVLALVDEILAQGHDIKEFLGGLLEHLRNILVARTTGSTTLIEASDVYRKRYAAEAQVFGVADLLRFQRLVGGTEAAIRWSAQPRFRLEADMVQLVTLQRAPEIAALLDDLDDLKKKLGDSPDNTRTGLRDMGSVTEKQAAPVPLAAHPPVQSGPRMASPRPGSTPPSQQVAMPPPPAARRLSDAEVTSRWDEFLGEVRRQRISLGSMLESTTLIGVRSGVIRVACATDFEVSSVHRNREFLSDIIVKVFGTPTRIEAELLTEQEPRSVGRPPQPPAQEPKAEEHPIITAMKRELGAEPLE